MDIGKWIIGIILLVLIDAIVAIGFYLAWVKKKTNDKIVPDKFPYNASKKQAVVWYIVWIIALFFNTTVYTLFAWLFAGWNHPTESMGYIAAFIITLFGYTIVFFITYVIIKPIIAKKIKDKSN